MRPNKLITGNEIWAGRSTTKRVEDQDGKLSKVIHNADGTKSLNHRSCNR
jgi:hypothetical protein